MMIRTARARRRPPRHDLAQHSAGVALLMVLLIVMAVTVIALGFVARTDSELLCGENMLLRTQMDRLAESGLEHARELILHPQDVPVTFWTNGAVGQQLMADSKDYYDIVAVTRPDPADYGTYRLECEAYRRLANGDKAARSRLVAALRLDPCVGLWTTGGLTFRQTWFLQGDLRSGGQVLNLGAQQSIDGDAFSTGLSGPIVGQHRSCDQLTLPWPPVTRTYLNPEYANGVLTSPVPGGTWQPAVWRYTGDLVLAGNATIQGMLLVRGNLIVRGNANKIVAAWKLPALYVSGDLVIENINGLEIDGLAVVDHDVRIGAGASGVAVRGALFAGGTLLETTADDSGSYPGQIQGNPTWTRGQLGGALQLHGAGDYVDCGANPAFNLTNQITVAAWVNPRDAGDGRQHPYVTKGDHAYALKHRHLSGDTSDSIEFFIYNGAAWQSARFPVDSTFNNTWHHLAGTYDGTNVRLYIDGTLTTSVSATGPIQSHPEHSLRFGANCEWPDRSYNGVIDDVRLYNVAVTGTTIKKIMTGTASATGLVAHWALNEGGSGVRIVADPITAAVVEGLPGAQTDWSPATGAFYESIRRQ